MRDGKRKGREKRRIRLARASFWEVDISPEVGAGAARIRGLSSVVRATKGIMRGRGRVLSFMATARKAATREIM
jgi:hypothetical protein